MTIVYWPMAKIRKKDGTIEKQVSYDPCNSIRKALEVITIWSDHYKFDIIEAWIDLVRGNYSERIEVNHCWVVINDDYTCIGDPYKKEEL